MAIDFLSLNQSGSSANAPPDTSGDPYESQVQDDRAGLQEAHRRNIALGLLAAGLATMGAQPRGSRNRITPLEALGQGGLTGLEVYSGAEGQLAKQEDAKKKEALARQRDIAQWRQMQELRGIQLGTLQERTEHDKVQEDLMQQQRDTAAAAQKSTDAYRQRMTDLTQQQRDIEGKRLGIEATTAGATAERAGIEAARYQQEYKPYGVPQATALLKNYGVKNAEALGAIIGNMPQAQADKEMNRAVRDLNKGNRTSYKPDAEGYVHALTHDAAGNLVNDVKTPWKGPSVGKGGNANREALKQLIGIPPETGAAPAVAATPGAAAPAPAAAPTATPPAVGAPSRPLPTVGYKTKLADGQYHMAGKIFTVKGGKVAKIDDAPSVSPAAE